MIKCVVKYMWNDLIEDIGDWWTYHGKDNVLAIAFGCLLLVASIVGLCGVFWILGAGTSLFLGWPETTDQLMNRGAKALIVVFFSSGVVAVVVMIIGKVIGVCKSVRDSFREAKKHCSIKA